MTAGPLPVEYAGVEALAPKGNSSTDWTGMNPVMNDSPGAPATPAIYLLYLVDPCGLIIHFKVMAIHFGPT